MTDGRSKALVPQAPTSLSPLSRLAERTLASGSNARAGARRRPDARRRARRRYATITDAVDAARDGDTVLVRPGRYEESVVVEGKTIRSVVTATATPSWSAGTKARRSTWSTPLDASGLTIVGGDPDPLCPKLKLDCWDRRSAPTRRAAGDAR